MILQKSSVLVKLTINQWDSFKKDKRVAERVDEEYNTAGGAGNYNKRLLDKSVIGPIQKLANKIRAEHARLTMPWCYDGVALLPSKLYFEYTTTMRDLTGKFEAAVDNLVLQYPVYIAQQRNKLGHLFNIDDYPPRDELKQRFSVQYRFFPVPQSDHFIVDLEAEEEAKLKAELQRELVDTQAAAMKTLYARVQAIVAHVHERLSDPENIFRDSLIDNVVQLVEVLPGLNVFDDPVLDEVTSQLRETLAAAEPAELRTNLTTRQQVASKAYDILTMLYGGAPPEAESQTAQTLTTEELTHDFAREEELAEAAYG